MDATDSERRQARMARKEARQAAKEAQELGIPAICLFPYVDPSLKTAASASSTSISSSSITST